MSSPSRWVREKNNNNNIKRDPEKKASVQCHYVGSIASRCIDLENY